MLVADELKLRILAHVAFDPRNTNLFYPKFIPGTEPL